MKKRPEMEYIEKDMEPGRLSLHGYLGDDKRPVEAIIDADRAELKTLGVTCEDIGKKMRRITLKGMEGLGDDVEVDGFTVEVTEYMGWAGCPFKDNKKAGKRLSNVTNNRTGKSMCWTDVGIHLIKDHCFFQGKGSAFRIEPSEIVEFLELKPTVREEELPYTD